MDRFHAGFLKSIGLIKDYLPHLVIAGGWAPFVYYRYLLGDTAKNPIRTADLDIVVGNRLPQAQKIQCRVLITEKLLILDM